MKESKLSTNSFIKGHFHAKLKSSNGEILSIVDLPNTITELMDAHVADQLSDSGDVAIGYMAVGTGSGQTSASTGLAVSAARVALDSTTQGVAAADNDVVYVATFSEGIGTGALTEAGLMLGDNNTSLMTYDDFSVINKGAGDVLEITWTISFGAS